MAEQAGRLGIATVTRFAEIVHTALIEMRGTTSPRLVLELLCARMQLPDAATDSAALLQRVERLERRLVATQSGITGRVRIAAAGGEQGTERAAAGAGRGRGSTRRRCDPVGGRCGAAANDGCGCYPPAMARGLGCRQTW